jgi:hypothetical protein
VGLAEEQHPEKFFDQKAELHFNPLFVAPSSQFNYFRRRANSLRAQIYT